MLFTYQVSDKEGRTKDGKIEAMSREEARNKLTLKGQVLISLNAIQAAKQQSKRKSKEIVFGRVKLLEKVMLAKHLSVMIKAGMSIDNALEVLRDNASPLLRKKLRDVLADVRSGHSLSSALRHHPKDFDMLFVNMIAAGETGGNLAKNLNLLSVQQRKSYDLKNKLKSAAMYPTLVLIAIVGLVAVVSKLVLPKIITFFTNLNIQLPLPTRILIAVANFFATYWFLIIGGIAVLVVLWIVLLRFAASRFWLHKLLLNLPITGKVSRNMNLALFCRTLGTLLESGITIDQSLQIVSQTLTNDVYKKSTLNIYYKVLKGSSLADAMAAEKYFPNIVSRMSRVGEESGNLSDVLDYLADFYELEVDTITKNLSTMLEPALLIVIGLGVGFVAISIINPIYDLTSKIGR